MTEVHAEDIQFAARDGWPLVGTLYRGRDVPHYGVLISAGTGFPRRFYRHIAGYLAARGAMVLTYDYRGIAESRNGDEGFDQIDYTDWGSLDLPSAIDTLRHQAKGLPLTHIGHSVGGHFLGLAANQIELSRHAFIGVGSGYWGAHHLWYIPLELYFWWGLGPYSLLRYKQIMPIGGWSGEALPPRLFRTWRRWCQRPGYLRRDLASASQLQSYAEVTAPIRSWVFSDDPIATRKSAPDLLALYPNASSELAFRRPRDLGLRRIGHAGGFLPGRERLWEEVAAWLSAGPRDPGAWLRSAPPP
ncbi:alpha/beta hydrolase [Phaeobacter sp. HF9A]|uniref:alpha/beta hydrolase family protein n=1 Tax=Phaeobacter sp. HF9A TaxID=2721561 RepID=UPI00142FFD7B|nr:alpha/beta hydrolase [Phaeobacter sp. HF9A]NIZ12817.1 alpha/beta hydrolase [Phaeobacter sp. HF9A]